MDKEQVKQDIETKQEELKILEAQILATKEQKDKDNLELQKKKIQEEIHTLQQKLDELKKLEKEKTMNDTKNEVYKLKNDVEFDSDWTYELIKWSKMYDKLLTILWTEAQVEIFAQDINTVVRKFLDQELEGFSNKIKNSMCVGIQFAMMETLVEQWAEWSANFFEAFSSTKTKDWGKAFEWLYKAFGKLGSANKFYTLANKVQNLTRYLSDNKSKITQTENIPELMNPYQFKVLLDKPVRSNQLQIDKLDITTILTLDSSMEVDIHSDEDKLKEIVNKNVIEGVITEKTISAIQKSLKTADKLLDSRQKLSSKATDLIDKISGFLDINIPFLGNLWELVGIEFPTDILGKRKDGGLINFVLGVFGFRWGLKGLHRKYIQEKLDGLSIDTTFITAAYEDFQKNTDTTITNDSPDSTWKICALSGVDAAAETVMKSKIPADYKTLKQSIMDNLNESVTLNPAVVQKFAPAAIITEGEKNIVDVSKITDTDIDTYLQYIIPKLAADDFITSDKVDKNSFTLAVIGGLTGDKYFIEGVNIGLLTISDFRNTSNNLSSWHKYSYEVVEETDTELMRLSAGPNEHYAENKKFTQYLHTLEGKNNLPYGIILNLMKTESGGQLYKEDGKTIISSSAGAKWLFQFIPETAKKYIVKLWYNISEYEKIFTNPIIGAKACALFLKDCKDAGDDTVSMLAHYNAWQNVIWWDKITIKNFDKLPKETQKYISKTWYAMLLYVGKSPVITKTQSEDPKLISPEKLQHFFEMVNMISVPWEHQEQKFTSNVLAENFDELVLIGDSHAGGLKNMSGLTSDKTRNFYYFNGYDSGQLLEKIKNNKNQYIDSWTKSLLLVFWTNDITKNITNKIRSNLEAIRNEISPVQLVLITLQYSSDKVLVPDSKVDEVNAIIRDFAKENWLPLIDINKRVSLVSNDYWSDKKHLTTSWYTKIVNEVIRESFWYTIA